MHPCYQPTSWENSFSTCAATWYTVCCTDKLCQAASWGYFPRFIFQNDSTSNSAFGWWRKVIIKFICSCLHDEVSRWSCLVTWIRSKHKSWFLGWTCCWNTTCRGRSCSCTLLCVTFGIWSFTSTVLITFCVTFSSYFCITWNHARSQRLRSQDSGAGAERWAEPAHRSAPASWPTAPRSAHAPQLFFTSAHRSAPAPAILPPLRSVFRSAPMLWCCV